MKTRFKTRLKHTHHVPQWFKTTSLSQPPVEAPSVIRKLKSLPKTPRTRQCCLLLIEGLMIIYIYTRTITAASSLPHAESASDLERGGRHTYYLFHLISSLFWLAHISLNNKYCLKSKCGVSWDVSWVLRCGGQTCKRCLTIFGKYNTWRRGRPARYLC